MTFRENRRSRKACGGHTGFLVFEGGFENAVQSYFCMQQAQANYAQETADVIRYADEKGQLLDTSAAVASGAFRRSQIMTRYSNGFEVWVNGHETETWKAPGAEGLLLPPNGWRARGAQGGNLTAFSAIVDGHRADYVDGPAYTYANGRGRLTRFEKAVCDGQLIAHRRSDGTLELIPVGRCRVFGVSLGERDAAALALDEEAKPIGPARTRFSRGLVYVEPVDGAFSYVLTPTEKPATELRCERVWATPGERVVIHGRKTHSFHVPADAPVGKQLRHQVDGAWIDFTVKPLVTSELRLLKDALQLELAPHLPAKADAVVRLCDQSQRVELVPEQTVRLNFARPEVSGETVTEMPLQVTAGELSFERAWRIKAEEAIRPIATPSRRIETGQPLRGQDETPLGGQTRASTHWTERSCGDQTKPCLFMHPPYVGGVGYTFALLEPVSLPAAPPAAFRCEIGKGDGSDPGDEQQGVWADVVVPLPPEAIQALTEWNTLKIENPGQDCFKTRRFWIHLQLADGREASAQITTTIYAQPPEWRYAEGIGVSFDQTIAVQLRFRSTHVAASR